MQLAREAQAKADNKAQKEVTSIRKQVKIYQPRQKTILQLIDLLNQFGMLSFSLPENDKIGKKINLNMIV